MKIQSYPQQSEYSQIVKLGVSRQVVIPKRIFHTMNLKAGEYLEVRQEKSTIVMTPKVIVDKELEDGLAQSFKDIKEGRSYGPFGTWEELIASLHRESKKLKKQRAKNSP